VDQLSHRLRGLLVGEAPSPQARQHLGLEDLDHVLDHPVQLLGGASAQLRQGGRGVQQLDPERLRATPAVHDPELDPLTALEFGHTGGQRSLGQEHIATLIAGDEHGYSDALLGVFDPIAPIASAALTALDAGDRQRYDELFAPTLPLARHLFGAPTYHYKTGVVFLAWLTGHQSHFTMVNGAHSARSIPHLCTLFRLADAAGLFSDPEQAAYRMSALLTTAGVEQ